MLVTAINFLAWSSIQRISFGNLLVGRVQISLGLEGSYNNLLPSSQVIPITSGLRGTSGKAKLMHNHIPLTAALKQS